MSGHLYLNCKHNGETFALVYYYGHNETKFSLNQTQRLINYIYDHIEDDYRYSIIGFVEKYGGSVGIWANNRDYVKTLFPDIVFRPGSRDKGLVILEPRLVAELQSQFSYKMACHVVIDFDNDKIEWDVCRYWSDMTAFTADETTAPLYTDNPTYSVGYYNKELNVVPFENISVIEDLILNNTIAIDGSGGVFVKSP